MHVPTIDWYQTNAEAYFSETAHLDNSNLLSQFLKDVPRHAPVLDLGCGSGRDLKAMIDLGYQAIGLEPAPALAALAKQNAKAVILQMTAEDAVIPSESFGGVWACASLLHVDRGELPDLLARIAAWLKPAGSFYTCFKDGSHDTIDARGRHFTNFTLAEASALVEAAGFELISAWQTESIVPGRVQVWNNILARKPVRVTGPWFAE